MLISINRNWTLLALSCALIGCEKQPADLSPRQQIEGHAAATQLDGLGERNGPLGISAGLPVAELRAMNFTASTASPSMFRGRPPKPLEEPAEYYVFATPKAGVCRVVVAIGVSPANGNGDQVKAKVDKLAGLVSAKYGKQSAQENSAREDFYRRYPNMWLAGLKKDSVSYSYTWQAGKTATDLPSKISSVEVTARATADAGAYAELQYTFSNFDECVSEDELRQSSNL